MNEHYFSEKPSTVSNKKSINVILNGTEYELYTDSGVFSNTKLDLGTSVLLKKAPRPDCVGVYLDAGCGWGPIALSLALENPQAQIFAVDVNERSLELTKENATKLGVNNIHCVEAEIAVETFKAKGITFDYIYSNPPIRIGKDAFHSFLLTYLSLLNTNGIAYMVVQKNLGADTCITWLNNQGFKAKKFASQKGYRIIEVRKV